MSTINASAGILTFNSASTLRRALESVREFDDIVVCDGGSSDATLNIAREFGANIILQAAQFKNADGTIKDFSGPRNQCLDAAKHDWFLYIDSDEAISDGLREDIRRITQKDITPGEPLVYKIPYGIMLGETLIRHASNYPGYQHRFFNKKSGARFGKPVHERIYFDRAQIAVGTLAHPWLVFTTRDDWDRYLFHTAKYRTMEAIACVSKPWSFYFKTIVLRGLRTSLGALGKSARNYAFYGFAYSLPVSGELGHMLAPFALMLEAARYKLFGLPA